jgi:hypothetical protein
MEVNYDLCEVKKTLEKNFLGLQKHFSNFQENIVDLFRNKNLLDDPEFRSNFSEKINRIWEKLNPLPGGEYVVKGAFTVTVSMAKA